MYDRKTLQKIEHEVMSELMNFQPVPFDQHDEGDRLYHVYRWGWTAALRWVLRKTTELMIDKDD